MRKIQRAILFLTPGILMRFLAKKCENIAKSRQKMIPGVVQTPRKTIVWIENPLGLYGCVYPTCKQLSQLGSFASLRSIKGKGPCLFTIRWSSRMHLVWNSFARASARSRAFCTRSMPQVFEQSLDSNFCPFTAPPAGVRLCCHFFCSWIRWMPHNSWTHRLPHSVFVPTISHLHVLYSIYASVKCISPPKFLSK